MRIVEGTYVHLGTLTPRSDSMRWIVEAAAAEFADRSGGPMNTSTPDPATEPTPRRSIAPVLVLLPCLYPIQRPGVAEAAFVRWRDASDPDSWRRPGVTLDDVFLAPAKSPDASWFAPREGNRRALREQARPLNMSDLTAAVMTRGAPRAFEQVLRTAHNVSGLHSTSPTAAARMDELANWGELGGRPPALRPKTDQTLRLFLSVCALDLPRNAVKRRTTLPRSAAAFSLLVAGTQDVTDVTSIRRSASALQEEKRQWRHKVARGLARPIRVDLLRSNLPLEPGERAEDVAQGLVVQYLASDELRSIKPLLAPPLGTLFVMSPLLGRRGRKRDGRSFGWVTLSLEDASEARYIELMREGVDIERVGLPGSQRNVLHASGFARNGAKGLLTRLRELGLFGELLSSSEA